MQAAAVGHPLDRPVWNALTGRQSSLAVGGPRALRFDPLIGPFAAAAQASVECDRALVELIPEQATVWLVERGPVAAPPGAVVARRAWCQQMVATELTAGAALAVEPLGEDDAADMRALAALTEPGPFFGLTHRLGGFVGLRHRGMLVAMAGERMRPGTYTEISGVCTHPDHRGRGLASGLVRAAAQAILECGETPFLQSYTSNAKANALYRSLGFTCRAEVMMTVLARGGSKPSRSLRSVKR